MTTATLGGVTLTNVSHIGEGKNANIVPIPIPLADSDETLVFDMLGVVETLTVEGAFTGEISANKTAVAALKALENGNQDSTVEFTSDPTGTVSVMVAEVNIDWEIPGFAANFSIKLIRGTT